LCIGFKRQAPKDFSTFSAVLAKISALKQVSEERLLID
jgi:hypothetical protein